MKRLTLLLLLLPLSSGALFAQIAYSISPASLPGGTVGVSYSQSLTVTPLTLATWSISAGSLPPGLTPPSGSSMAGIISGTPTIAGTYSFTVQASFITSPNGAPTIVRNAYTVVIAGPQAPPVSITTSSFPDGVIGVSYSQGITATGGYGLGTYTYALAQGTLPPGLQLNPSTGVIFGTPTSAGSFGFVALVSSQSGTSSALTASATFSIGIAAPALSITTGSLPAGTVGVAYSQALAASGGYGPGTYTYALAQGSLPPGLQLNPSSGVIFGTPTGAGSFGFVLQVSSQSGTSSALTASATFSIGIAAPALSITTGSLPAGTVGVAYSQALAASGGYGPGTYTYSLAQGSLPSGLQLNSTSGVIYGTPTTVGSSSFMVQVSSQSGTSSALTASATFSINIAAPALSITTGALPAGTVGTAYSQTLNATGGTPPYTWRLTSGSLPLPGGLTLGSNGSISGTPTTAGSFTFQVTVGDSQQGSASGTFTIKINPAALVITTTSLPAGTVGTAYTGTTLAATGGTPPYTWSLSSGTTLPGGLSMSSAGAISGTPTASGNFTIQVTATDSQQSTASASLIVRIAAAALVVTTSSLPAGTLGTAYTATTLAATGGTPPYTWSVASGTALPGGLSISSAGVVSGTPTAAGTFPVTLQVADSAQATATRAYSITVAAAAVPLSITTQSPLPGGTVGVAYTLTFAATGGTSPYNWYLSSGALPPGLTLNAGSGSLTGTPTTAGAFSFTLEAADAADHTVLKAFAVSMIAAVKISAAVILADGVTGTPYTAQFLASGGLTPYVWSVAGGSIPGGLSLSTATGLLSGTPTTPGTFTFTIGVTDQNGGKDGVPYTIRIVAPLSITTQAPLPGGVVGAVYTQAFAATGGTSPYQWFVSANTPLPAGLALSSTSGGLSGTPTAAGTFNFTIQVVDAAGRSASGSFSIVVGTALTITTATLPNGTVGTAYSQTLAAAGGNGALTWSIATGALPGGITLNSTTGALSGFPSAPGTFTFTVGVAFGTQTASKALAITVGVPTGPQATFSGLTATAAPATQQLLTMRMTDPYPLDISGLVTMTFVPDSGLTDDPAVQFTSGGRTASFTVPMISSSLTAVFAGGAPSVQTGTVAGTITLTVKLTAAGADVTPSPAPSTTIRIAKSAPVIVPQGVTVTRTSAGFNLVVKGYATSREMLSAAVTLTAATGVTLASCATITPTCNQVTISLSSVFTTWYADPTSAAFGSNFLLTLPFTIANGTSTAPLTSVSVQLTSAQGNSNSMSAAY